MMVPTCVELIVIERIELDSKYREESGVSESNWPSLLPDEHLNGKCPIHANWNQFLTILREDKVQNSSWVWRVEYDHSFHGQSIPNVDLRVDVNFTCSHYPKKGVLCNCRYFELVRLVKLLRLFHTIIKNCESRDEINYIFVTCSVWGIILHRLILFKQVLIIITKDSRQKCIELLAKHLSQIWRLGCIDQEFHFCVIYYVLFRFVEKMHVHQGVPFIWNQNTIYVLQIETYRRRPNPCSLSFIKSFSPENPVYSRVVAASDEYSLIMNIIGLPCLDLPAIVEFQDQSLIQLWMENYFLYSLTGWYFVDSTLHVDLALFVP